MGARIHDTNPPPRDAGDRWHEVAEIAITALSWAMAASVPILLGVVTFAAFGAGFPSLGDMGAIGIVIRFLLGFSAFCLTSGLLLALLNLTLLRDEGDQI